MTQSFFQELYVERRQLEYLETKVGTSQLAILNGYVGCGKSTLLMKFALDLKLKNTPSVFVDTQDAQIQLQHDLQFKSEAEYLKTTTIDNTIISDIYMKTYERLYAVFLTYVDASPKLKTEWSVFLIENDKRMFRVLDYIREALDVYPTTVEQWKGTIAQIRNTRYI